MTGIAVISCLMNLLFDFVFIIDLRKLVYSFLLSKRNLKGAKKIHKAQTKKARLTLSYIRNYAIYPKHFNFYYKFRAIYFFSLIPQYVFMIILICFYALVAFVCEFFLLLLKLVLMEIIIGGNFSGQVSKFDRRYIYKKKKRRK